MSMCQTFDDDIETEKYQQQTVVDTLIETGQPSFAESAIIATAEH